MRALHVTVHFSWTGGDAWRLIAETDSVVHTYYVPPGQYTNLTAIIPEQIVTAVSKVHPNTQYYTGSTEGLGPIAPVALNQIEKGTPHCLLISHSLKSHF